MVNIWLLYGFREVVAGKPVFLLKHLASGDVGHGCFAEGFCCDFPYSYTTVNDSPRV